MNRWKIKGKASAKYEMNNLHLRDILKLRHYGELNEDQNKSILEYHIFIKENIEGKTKGRTVAGGNKQSYFISKEDSISPTVATEYLILSCIIDEEKEIKLL